MSAIKRTLAGIGAVAGKELYSYLVSPMAYAVAAVFLVINGFIFYLTMSAPYAEASLRPILSTTAFLLLLVIPVLTMRLIAEERGTGTMELLMTFPLTDAQVVIGKFLATFLVYLLMLVPTLLYVVVIGIYGSSEWGMVIATYLGLFLLGGAFISAGMLSSSITRNQIVAGAIGIGLLLMLWVLSAAGDSMGSGPGAVISYLSLSVHFDNFGQGLIDLKDVVYYLSFIVATLFVTIRVVESSRWRA